ncbi:MAG: hypothetical protein PHO08_19900 [Methylococcales bacterium]|nr:hypothetical protein [Methylococcales bacterium]MDD5633576.1 hypothetical protein [Methylococcales bacterium]
MTDSKIEPSGKRLANGIPPREVAKNLGVFVPTIPASHRCDTGVDESVPEAIWYVFSRSVVSNQTIGNRAESVAV